MSGIYKRRNYFIKRNLQARYMFSYFLMVVLGSFFFAFIFSLLSANTLTIGFDETVVQLGRSPNVLMRYLLNSQWIFILTGGLVVVIISLFLTHRLAGPIYRFEKSLDAMLQGDLSFRIQLRKKDEGKELAEKLNTFLDTMCTSLGEIQKVSADLDQALKGVTDTAGEPEKARAVHREIATLNRRLAESLGRFTFRKG